MNEHVMRCLRDSDSGLKQLSLDTFRGKSLERPDAGQSEEKEGAHDHSESKANGAEPDEHPKIRRRTSGNTLTAGDRLLVDFICNSSMPLKPFTGPEFEALIRYWSPNASAPSYDTIRKQVLERAEELLHSTLSNLRGEIVSLMIDGGTVGARHWLAIGMYGWKGTYFYGVRIMNDSSAGTISRLVTECIKDLARFGIGIAAVVSDNASNMIAALDENKTYCVQSLSGSKIIRVSCACHTAQLAVKDLAANGPTFQVFRGELRQLLEWLHEDEVREKLRELGVGARAPDLIATRWNTEYEGVEYIIRHEKEVRKAMEWFTRAVPPPFPEIPEPWKDIYLALKPLKQFSDTCEKQTANLVDEYLVYREVIKSWSTMTENQYAASLSFYFQERFRKTADSALAQLAYLLTPDGVREWRDLWSSFSPARPPCDEPERMKFEALFEEEHKVLKKFVDVFMQYYPGTEENPEEMLRYWLKEFDMTESNSARRTWMRLSVAKPVMYTNHSGEPVVFTWRNMAIMAMKLLTIPPSESACERAFSSLRDILTDTRLSMKDDLVQAQMLVRCINKLSRERLKLLVDKKAR